LHWYVSFSVFLTVDEKRAAGDADSPEKETMPSAMHADSFDA